MAIYDLFEERHEFPEESGGVCSPQKGESLLTEKKERSSLFSAVAARLFFLLLIAVDILWSLWSLSSIVLFGALNLLSLGKISFVKKRCFHALKSFKRSLVCGIALFLALFSPSFGIMVACTYFVSRDKEGIDECVPTSLQEQFKEFLAQE